MKNFCDRLKLVRGELAQVAAAKRIGITQQGWARYESGKVLPNPELLHQICCKFGVSADYLLGLSDDRHGTVISVTNEEYEAKLAEKDAEIARLNGIIEGLRLAFTTTGKGK